MEARYIKIDYVDAISAKKELLSSELNSLTIARKMREYKYLRRREFVLKNKLKTAFSVFKSKNNLLLSTLPKDEWNINKDKQKKKNGKSPVRDLDDELEEIKKKLAKLS